MQLSDFFELYGFIIDLSVIHFNSEYYLDNTFTLTNIQFDHDRINDMWYDPSLYLVNSNFYYYNKAIEVDSIDSIEAEDAPKTNDTDDLDKR